MEPLRLSPPIPMIVREAARGAQVGSTLVPSGTLVHVSSDAIHHRAEFWDGPDSVDAFELQRWINDYHGGTKDAYSFLAFSGGTRAYIGQEVAMCQLRGLLAMLVGKFEFSVPEGVEKPRTMRMLWLVGTLTISKIEVGGGGEFKPEHGGRLVGDHLMTATVGQRMVLRLLEDV